MVQYVITPWRHQSELIEVREKLYGKGKDVDGMRRAVEIVGVWSRFTSSPDIVRLLYRFRGFV
jgi:hypothetical protein